MRIRLQIYRMPKPKLRMWVPPTFRMRIYQPKIRYLYHPNAPKLRIVLPQPLV